MIEDSIVIGGHNWEKQNLVTQSSPKGVYDTYKCRYCGLEVKSYKLGFIQVKDGQLKKLYNCPCKPKATKIKIRHCYAHGSQFDNLTPGSIHNIVNSPKPNPRKRGEWVMGVGKKVLVLFNEFDYVEE